MYYCDAYGMGGYYCAEFDIMQANMYGFQAEVHPNGTRSGNCIQNSSSLGTEFGPTGTLINTSDPFHVSIKFNADSTDATIFKDYEITFK